MDNILKYGHLRIRLLTVVTACVYSVCTPALAHADLIDQDWVVGGDTYQFSLIDTSTGLEWLDVSVTYDVSYETVVNNHLAPGGTYEGFRYATADEVLHLWSQAGITNTQHVWQNMGEWNAVQDLGIRLGTTFLGELPISGGHVLGMVDSGPPLPSNQRWVMELAFALDDVSTRTSNEFYTRDITLADSHYGSYLVRKAVAPSVLNGDINGDWQVNAADVLLAQRVLHGQLILSDEQFLRGDVAPLISGVPSPNGVIDLGDVLAISRKALGQVNF